MAKKKAVARRRKASFYPGFSIKHAGIGAGSMVFATQVANIIPSTQPWVKLKAAPYAVAAILAGLMWRDRSLFSFGVGQAVVVIGTAAA